MKKFAMQICLLLAFAFAHAEEIHFSAGSMKGNTGSLNEYTKLEKNAVIKTKDMQIFADEIVLSGEDYRYIEAKNGVRGSNSSSGFDFSCTRFSYDRVTKIIVLEGNVQLSDVKNDVKAKAQLIEFNQDTNVALMQIGVELVSKSSVCTSALALYRQKEQIVELSGLPKIVRGTDVFSANEITLDLVTEEITLDGKVKGAVSGN